MGNESTKNMSTIPKKRREKENQIFLFEMTHPPLVGIMNGSHYWI